MLPVVTIISECSFTLEIDAHTHTHTQRFRDSREEGPEEALDPTAGGIVDWHGHAHSLRDVVESNGDGQGPPEGRGGESGHKCGQTLR